MAIRHFLIGQAIVVVAESPQQQRNAFRNSRLYEKREIRFQILDFPGEYITISGPSVLAMLYMKAHSPYPPEEDSRQYMTYSPRVISRYTIIPGIQENILYHEFSIFVNQLRGTIRQGRYYLSRCSGHDVDMFRALVESGIFHIFFGHLFDVSGPAFAVCAS